METKEILKTAEGRCSCLFDKPAQTHCGGYVYGGDVFGCQHINKNDYSTCLYVKPVVVKL